MEAVSFAVEKPRRLTRIPSRLQIRPIIGPPGDLSGEILNLFMQNTNEDQTIRAIGVRKENVVAQLVENLPAPGSAWFAAQDKNGLRGIVGLEPKLWPSAILHWRIWEIRKLILASGESEETAGFLIRQAMASLNKLAEFVLGNIPASNQATLDGLFGHGFRIFGEQVVAVAGPKEGPFRKSHQGFSIVPLRPEHIDGASRIVSHENAYRIYSEDRSFPPSRVSLLAQKLLAHTTKESDQGAFVALGKGEQVLGVATYSLEEEWVAGTEVRMAVLDVATISHDIREENLFLDLHRHALQELSRLSVQVALCKCVGQPAVSSNKLRLLSQCGYTVTERNQILCRWHEPQSRAADTTLGCLGVLGS